MPQAVGQLLMVGFDGTEAPASLLEEVRTGALGGVVLLGHNVVDPEQVRALTDSLQEAARRGGQPPLLVAIDHEGGNVQRLRTGVTRLPSQMAVASRDNLDLAYLLYRQHARELRGLGINWTFAPVLDVNNNPRNPVIGTRAFSDDVDRVVRFGEVAVRAWLDGGIIPCGKHFPGHGDTDQDSHLTLPSVSHSRDRLDGVELKPFRAAFRAGLPTVMTAHVQFPAVEPSGRPATLSRRVMTDLLRDELGFDGVLITDSLGMKAISETVGSARGALEAVKAGADLCLFGHPAGQDVQARSALEAALETGELDRHRLSEALSRLTRLRERVQDPGEPVPPNPDLAWEAYSQAVRIVGDRSLLPIPSPVHVISFEAVPKTGAEDTESRVLALLNGLEEAGRVVHHARLVVDPDPAARAATLASTNGGSLVAVVDHAVFRSGQEALVQAVPPSVPLYLVALSNPTDLRLVEPRPHSVGLTLCDPTASAQVWLARALVGAANALD